jgi:hypothetical protein
MKKAASFSELYLYTRDKERYIKRYVEGVDEPEDEASERRMLLGKICHAALENPNYRWEKALIDGGFQEKIPVFQTVLGKLAFKRLGKPEFPLMAKTRVGDNLFALLDDIDPKQHILNEYKTYNSDGTDGEKWFPNIVAQHKQISFYNWMYSLSRHRNFRVIFLYAIDLTNATVKTFETQRGPHDNEFIRGWAEGIIAEMKAEGLWEKRLSREDRVRQATHTLFPEPVEDLAV